MKSFAQGEAVPPTLLISSPTGALSVGKTRARAGKEWDCQCGGQAREGSESRSKYKNFIAIVKGMLYISKGKWKEIGIKKSRACSDRNSAEANHARPVPPHMQLMRSSPTCRARAPGSPYGGHFTFSALGDHARLLFLSCPQLDVFTFCDRFALLLPPYVNRFLARVPSRSLAAFQSRE
jgi:hypothetical protein